MCVSSRAQGTVHCLLRRQMSVALKTLVTDKFKSVSFWHGS